MALNIDRGEGFKKKGLPSRRLTNLTLEAAAFTIRQSAPDSEALVMLKCILETLISHRTSLADTLGFAGGASLLRKEGFRIGLRAQCLVLPLLLDGAKKLIERHLCGSTATENSAIIRVFLHANSFLRGWVGFF